MMTNKAIISTLVSPIRYCTNRVFSHLASTIKPQENADVLDVGCGNGYYPILVANGYSGSYLGIDMRPSAGWQNTKKGELIVSFLELDAHRIEDVQRRFDIVLSVQSMEHMRDDTAVMKGIAQLLKPNGSILLTVPSKQSYILYGQHGERRYNISAVYELAAKCGLRVHFITRIGGAATFFVHFVLWSIPCLLLKIPIWKIYQRSTMIVRAIRFLENIATYADFCLPILQGGYAAILVRS